MLKTSELAVFKKKILFSVGSCFNRHERFNILSPNLLE